jgi:NADPH-dependent curcumin reductase CurA
MNRRQVGGSRGRQCCLRHAVVQCAKLAGARVIATASSESKRQLIESLGAD